jgi:hypothetical protein
MGRMGCAPRMVRASSLPGTEVWPLNIPPRPNMTVDVVTSIGEQMPSQQPPADAASAEQVRRDSCDGLMLTLPALLFQNGLPDRPPSLIEPHRNHAGVWRIKFSYEASEPLSMDIVQASTTSSRLREIGEIELADEVASAVTSAKRYATM